MSAAGFGAIVALGVFLACVFFAGYAVAMKRGERDLQAEREAWERDRLIERIERMQARTMAQGIVKSLQPAWRGEVRRMEWTPPQPLPELDSVSSAYLRGFRRRLDPAYCWTEGERARVRAFRGQYRLGDVEAFEAARQRHEHTLRGQRMAARSRRFDFKGPASPAHGFNDDEVKS